jgi:hypothetical protein
MIFSKLNIIFTLHFKNINFFVLWQTKILMQQKNVPTMPS